MPPRPVYIRYHAEKFDRPQPPNDTMKPSSADPAASMLPQVPVMPKPASVNSFGSGPSAPNLSVDTSEPSSGGWISAKGKQNRANNYGTGSSSRGRRNPSHQQTRQNDDRPTQEEMNAELNEKINAGTHHRRNKRDPAGEVAATLKQYHNNAIRQYCDPPLTEVDPSSWLSCGEIPTTNEIMDITEQWQNIDPQDNSVIMRGNKLKGLWESKDAYLSAHFEMLREDVSRPLREAVCWVKNFPDAGEDSEGGGNIGIYTKVHITAITFSPRGMGFRVVFSLGKVGKNVRWEQSKRLLTGSIVALTPSSDMFRTKCIMAVVAARPMEGLRQNPPEIDLFFANPKQIEIDPVMDFTMVEERSSFFEADRHTMKALQKMMSEPFPLSEHLIGVQSAVEAPKYVSQQPFRNLSSIFSSEDTEQYEIVDIVNDWPKDANTSLDNSQEAALRRIMTKKVAIIQGPPGTGKTHVSVMSLKAMLENMKSGGPPIIIACQTNHALDQLLRHVAAFESNFARLGGRSQDKDIIKKRTLYYLREGKQIRVLGGMRHDAKISLDNLTRQMSDALIPLQMDKGLLDHKLLFQLQLLTESQCKSLIKGDPHWSGASSRISAGDETPLKQWLGKQLMENKRSFDTETFGYEYEEADLEFEQLKELEAENCAQDDDDDFESLRGHAVSLWDAFVGKATSNVSDDDVRALLMNQDLYKISSKFRGAVYNYLQRQAKDRIRIFVREQAATYDRHVARFRAGGWERDAILLRKLGIKLIGMTTTGLSKYRALVSALSPKIVVIEEAAETMEAPVISACVPSLEHLILVGDHKQLRPQCAVKDLQHPPFSLNVSLFERLVNNNIEYVMLKRQRRMIPEIRRILKPIYGKEITDHPTMADLTIRPPVPGLGGCNSFFYSHSWPEGIDEQNSWMNSMEADMIVGFFNYLLHNGMTEKQITVLTFYHGQRKLLLRKLREHPELGRGKIFKVVTVDSYQGEENDIVILSMVRSNDIGKIGFLDVENRVCVALSRAKSGFFIFGNAELLCTESKLWAKVITVMAGKSKELPATGPKCRVVFRVPVLCNNHGRKTWIEEPEEWETVNGGCPKKCRDKLDCGHTCQLACHPFDHSSVWCGEMCTKVLPCGHGCKELCGETCLCAQCKIKYGELVDSRASDSSSVENWSGYARGGHKQHDHDLREKYLREMDRIAEEEPFGALDKFLTQQTNNIDSPTLREASALHISDIEPSSSKTKITPPAHASSMSVSPLKSSFTNLSSAAGFTRIGDQAKFTSGSGTSEPLTGYSGSTGSKPFVSKTNGHRPLSTTPPLSASSHPAHPQHPVAPQQFQVKRSRTKPRGLENTVNKMGNQKASSATTFKHQVEPINVQPELLIDLS